VILLTTPVEKNQGKARDEALFLTRAEIEG
jgi:hypothetical protein